MKSITKNDEGFWRLRSTRENDFMQGISYIEVSDDLPTYQTSDFQTYKPNEKFTPELTDYCYVFRPGLDLSDFNVEFPSPSECVVPDVNIDPESNGVWNVLVGIQKKTDEILYQIHVDPSGNLNIHSN